MFDSNQFFGGERGFYPLTIDQSLRFNDNDSAYLNKTLTTPTDNNIWTWSGWVKRCNLGSFQTLFSAGSAAANGTGLRFDSSDRIQFLMNNGTTANLVTSAVYRDVSSWYHIVLQVDTDQVTPADRINLWVNGEEVTAFSTATYPSLSAGSTINTSGINHAIGSFFNSVYSGYLDGYLAEVHFIDGTAYDADAFGELKSGVWVAKAPSVTYGTNGFYLDFANSADIGNDVSGEGNDWTPNNFTASDVVLDSPTDNFATLNPLRSSTITLSDGNLKVTSTVTAWAHRLSTIGVSSGKWYCEYTVNASSGSDYHLIGISTGDLPSTAYVGGTATSWGYYGANGTLYNNASATSYGSAFTVNDVIGIAFDADAGTLEFFKNNVSQGEITSIPSGEYFFGFSVYQSGTAGSVNFGQQDFTYTPPSGYLALSTANLPDPVIDPAQDESPEDYFDTLLWTGNSATSREIDGLTFQPDFVWIKDRSVARDSVIFDVVRGATNFLRSGSTGAEGTSSTTLQSFDSDGFTVGNNAANNNSGETYVAWNWKANGSGVTNTDGSITSTVSANTTSGFSIVSYTGNNGTPATIGHGLSETPEMIIIKNRGNIDGGARSWAVYHSAIGATKYLNLNLTNAATTSSDWWNNTAPTSSVFTIGASYDVNEDDGHIAYCFHSVEGFSKFGSYVGNGSADGPFVYCGFRPAFVLYKEASGADSGAAGWVMWDSKRNSYNALDDYLLANSSAAEGVFTGLDFLSNGFKVRNNQAENNGSGDTYIFMAFSDANGPFKYSNAR